MTTPIDNAEVERIVRGLSRPQREYVVEGPHPHWTQTRWALERKGVCNFRSFMHSGDNAFTPLGLAVRAALQENQS